MRITFRAHGGSLDYWQKRWGQISADDGKLNLGKYPGKYAEAAVSQRTGEILEAGCGAGRVVIHYHRLGRKIVGMDFVATAIDKIRAVEPGLELAVGDVRSLPFADGRFDVVLAFGLYHSLEDGVEKAFAETRRVMRPDGLLVASMRADNIQNRVIDWMASRGIPAAAARKFHKANYTRAEFVGLLRRAGFALDKMEYVENMPFVYKFRWLRHPTHREFNETVARGEGYRLSRLGNTIQGTLMRLFPASFCNIMVATARVVS